MRDSLRIGAAVLAASTALVAQSDVVTSASLDVQRRPVTAVLVAITNHGHQPISAISVLVKPTTGQGGSQLVGFHFSGRPSGATPAANAVILPGETRTRSLRLPGDPATETAVVQGVMFEDGSVEGTAAARRAFSTMLSPPGMPPPPPMPDPPDTAVTSVTAATRPGAAFDIVALVKNLRTVPIRALTIKESDRSTNPSPHGAPSRAGAALTVRESDGSISNWLCDGTMLPGSRLIQPGETREILVNTFENESNSGTPPVVLVAVLWEDQKAEGTAAGREVLLKLGAKSTCATRPR